MSDKIDKTTVFKVGQQVRARGNFGVSRGRKFKPLRDQADEFAEYTKLKEGENKEALAAFSAQMVYPPWEVGFRIIEGELYEIRIEGNYGELFHPVQKKSSTPLPRRTSIIAMVLSLGRNLPI